MSSLAFSDFGLLLHLISSHDFDTFTWRIKQFSASGINYGVMLRLVKATVIMSIILIVFVSGFCFLVRNVGVWW